MKRLARSLAVLPLLALTLALEACGAGSNQTLAALVDHAPVSAAINLEMGGASTTVALPYGAAPTPDAAPTAPSAAMAAVATPSVTGDSCHPHLFERTAEVAWTLNAIFRRHLRHVDALVARHPDLLAGDTATWTETGSALEVQRQFTITRSADGTTYSFELFLAPAGQTPPQWVKVFDGTETDSSSATVKHRTGAMSFDYDALHGVLPLERITGTVDLTFDRVRDPGKPAPGVRRSTDVTFTGFSFGPLDPHGPRAGHYQHLSEPGIGGDMSFQDSVVLLCPPNPSSLQADTTTVSRWYRAADGSLHGRSDALATGGQIAAGETWQGVSCYSGMMGADPATATMAAYWMMKLEDGTGATVVGSSFEAGAGAVACDTAFGAVPSPTGNGTDFDFTSPVTFPGAW
jgi:hypothetical protein